MAFCDFQQLASRYGSLLETIAGMITELTGTLNQFSVYQTLFPSSQELSSCIKILITDYVGFCISAYKFFIRYRPYRKYHILHM